MVPPYQVIRNTVSLRSICNNQYLWVWVCTEMQTISVQVAWFSLLLFRILGPMYSHVLQSLESYNSSWGLSCCMLHAATCSYWTGTSRLLLLPFFLPYWSSHGPIRVQYLKSVSSFIFMIFVTTIKSSSLSLSLFLSTSSPSGCYRLLSAMSSPLLPSPPTDLCHQLLQCKVKIGSDTEWTKIWYLGVLIKKKKKLTCMLVIITIPLYIWYEFQTGWNCLLDLFISHFTCLFMIGTINRLSVWNDKPKSIFGLLATYNHGF